MHADTVVILLSSALLAAVVPAQTMTATGTFSVGASAESQIDSRTGPFPGPVSAGASSTNYWVSATGSGSLQGLTVIASGTTSTGCPLNTYCPVGASVLGDILLTVSAPAMMGGLVEATVSSAGVDIGDDGSFEINNTTASIPVLVPPRGLPIRLRLSASRFGTTATFASATVRFRPQPTVATGYGPACGGELAGAAVATGPLDNVMFSGVQLTNSPFALLILGVTQLNVPIPPTQCPLLTDLTVVIPIAVTNGQCNLRYVLPHLPGLAFFSQIIVSATPPPNVEWYTTNGVIFALP